MMMMHDASMFFSGTRHSGASATGTYSVTNWRRLFC